MDSPITSAETSFVSPPEPLPPPPPVETLRATVSVAPVWHTVLLLVLILAMSFSGGSGGKRAFSATHSRVPLYLMTIGVEWLMFGYVVYGIRHRGKKLSELVAGRWQSVEDALIDVAIGVGFWFVALMILGAIGVLLGLTHPGNLAEAKEKIGFLAPRGGLEISLFLLLSASAGICEEVVFRGYLQRQFAALTHTAIGGAILQAVIFGGAHAYEGKSRMFLLGVFGALFSVLALTRNSLRPGILAHFLHDGVAGFVMGKLVR